LIYKVCLSKLTFPNATVEVAMSNAKLSPFKAGATQHIGFDPKACSLDLVGNTQGDVFVKDMPIRPCFAICNA
jgi:hypothetical protein